MEQRIAEAAQAADAAVEQRVSAALQGQVDATQLQEVAARAAKAEREAAHLAAQVEALQVRPATERRSCLTPVLRWGPQFA